MDRCIICGKECRKNKIGNNMQYDCPNCGKFLVSHDFEDFDIDIHCKIDKPLLSGYIREQNEYGNESVFISNENVFELLNSPLIPKTVKEKVNKFIVFLYRRTKYFGEPIKYDFHTNFACSYAKNSNEIREIYSYLMAKEYIKSLGSNADGVKLEYKGIDCAEEILKTKSETNIAFVAMWFNTEMDEIYNNGIKAAIEDQKELNDVEYKSFRIDKKEHNDDITDEIIANIKNAKFVIADMTGYRGGVYYEAGFARGLGKPVIITCRKDWFESRKDENGKTIQEGVHFDINHLNIIVYENSSELKEKLISRIRATIL